MMLVIVFNLESGPVVLFPADCGLTIQDVGRKDVPGGVPFWIVSDEDLPRDIPQEAWELDESALGEPDGIGGTYEVKSDD